MFPEIKLSDSIVIPTYLLYLSILYSFLIFYVARRVERFDKPNHHAFNLALIAMVSGFIGARLMHVLFELPRYYQEDWGRIFRFWDGGFVFFGGFLFSLLAAFIYTRRQKISFLEWMDFYAPVGALGYGLGRISCFLAGCCYGRACDLPWSVQFPWDSTQTWRHPTQLYAVIWELVLFAILIGFEKRKLFLRSKGLIFFFWITFHGVGRLMMESFRDDFRGDMISGQSISTWVSLALIVVGIAGQIGSMALSVPPDQQSEPNT